MITHGSQRVCSVSIRNFLEMHGCKNRGIPLNGRISVCLPQVTFLFSDRGIPDGHRHMNGYGSHTFKLVNANGEAVYCKFHYKVQGVWTEGTWLLHTSLYLCYRPEVSPALLSLPPQVHRIDIIEQHHEYFVGHQFKEQIQAAQIRAVCSWPLVFSLHVVRLGHMASVFGMILAYIIICNIYQFA